MRLLCGLVLLFLGRRALARDVDNEQQTLIYLDSYSAQRPCARSCFVSCSTGCCSDEIAEKIGCQQGACGTFNPGAPNHCYCRGDMQPEVVEYLLACVKKQCTNGNLDIDMARATSIFASYCTSLGYDAVSTPQRVKPTPPPAVITSADAPQRATPTTETFIRTEYVTIYRSGCASGTGCSGVAAWLLVLGLYFLVFRQHALFISYCCASISAGKRKSLI
jgi:hypothetical protein